MLILITVIADLWRRAPAAGALMAVESTTARAPRGRAMVPLGHETVLAGILALALLVLAFTSEQFFTVDNLLNQGRLACEVGLIALPMTFIIITGGIDLSVGSIARPVRDHARRLRGRLWACRSSWRSP